MQAHPSQRRTPVSVAEQKIMNDIVNELTEEDVMNLRTEQVAQKEGEPESQQITDGASKSKASGKGMVRQKQNEIKSDLIQVVQRN